MLSRYRNWKILLLIIDISCLLASFQFGYLIRFGEFHQQILIGKSYLYLISTVSLFYFLDLYNPWSPYSDLPFHYRSILGVILAAALASLIAYITNDYSEAVILGRSIMFVSFIVFLPFSVIIRWLLISKFNPDRSKIKLLILATPSIAVQFEHELQQRSEKWKRVYLLDRVSEKTVRQLQQFRVDAKSNALSELDNYLQQSWTVIVLATDQLPPKRIETLIKKRLQGTVFLDFSDFYERFFFKVPTFYLSDSWFLISQGFWLLKNNYGQRLKVWSDKLLSFLFLIPALPIIGLIGIAIFIDSGRPIFFRQIRTGEAGKPFSVIKLRTMIKDAEKDGAKWATKGDARITRLGRFLRTTRLDELPQLINVLKGEMSFIGPRPERPIFNQMLEKEIPFYNLRHLVRPGLTGWAQVMYPYGASVEDAIHKLEYDLYYIKNFSFILDFLILLKTVKTVLFRRGQ